MRGGVLVGLLMNVIGLVVGLVMTPWTTAVLGFGLLAIVLGALAWWMHATERQPLGAFLLMASGIVFLPAGLVAIAAGIHSYQHHRYGVHIGGHPAGEPSRLRPRPWTVASGVFGAIGVGGGMFALTSYHVGDMSTLGAPLVVVAAALVAVLAGLESALLWSVRDSALRLGLAICGVGLATLGVGGFYLNSYVAVAFLGLPLYGALLVWQGRTRWDGLPSK